MTLPPDPLFSTTTRNQDTAMSEAKEEIVRVFRLLEYVGPRSHVENTLRESIQGVKLIPGILKITAVTVSQFPEVIDEDEGYSEIEREYCKFRDDYDEFERDLPKTEGGEIIRRSLGNCLANGQNRHDTLMLTLKELCRCYDALVEVTEA